MKLLSSKKAIKGYILASLCSVNYLIKHGNKEISKQLYKLLLNKIDKKLIKEVIKKEEQIFFMEEN
jgi:hypothetical protein